MNDIFSWSRKAQPLGPGDLLEAVGVFQQEYHTLPTEVLLPRALWEPQSKRYREIREALEGDLKALQVKGVRIGVGPGGQLAWEVWMPVVVVSAKGEQLTLVGFSRL